MIATGLRCRRRPRDPRRPDDRATSIRSTAAVLEEIGVPHAMTGLRDTVDAIGGAMRWSAWLRSARTVAPAEDELELGEPRRAVVGGT